MTSKYSRKSAITLMEVIVVLLILSIMATIIFLKIPNYYYKGVEESIDMELDLLLAASISMKSQHPEVELSIENLYSHQYLDQIPKSPVRNFQYQVYENEYLYAELNSQGEIYERDGYQAKKIHRSLYDY